MFRLSIVMVLLLATVALGFIAYTANMPKPVAQAPADAQKAPEPEYDIATRDLMTGTFLRAGDFVKRPWSDKAKCQAGPDEVLSGDEIRESRGLLGSLVINYVEAGCPIPRKSVVRPRERGFLANVLAKGARAISLNVDTESGVSGLISPGDRVDVILTQSGKGDRANPSLSEIVLRNVRIIAIDQEIVEGDQVANAATGKIVEGVPGANAEIRKVARSVSLELSPEQVKKIALAKDLGKLSLAVRSADEVSEAAGSGAPLAVKPANAEDAADSGATFGRDVSPELARQQDAEIAGQKADIALQKAMALQTARQKAEFARQITTVVVYSKGHCKEYTVRSQGFSDAGLVLGCRGYPEIARTSAALASDNGEKAKE
ncbi:Flp pilus assembly protein CpaB [uncultured Rhodoblastus sp.]|uniref:Flp pilus assembly protein CpaB n=1 Tax=uncultured Rhodoblastus sp. TaxID=543037 RepID=UPI0025F16717|nr:Flp pilus assembly protein CpaB [uncultured Rhodoblastus sp.]